MSVPEVEALRVRFKAYLADTHTEAAIVTLFSDLLHLHVAKFESFWARIPHKNFLSDADPVYEDGKSALETKLLTKIKALVANNQLHAAHKTGEAACIETFNLTANLARIGIDVDLCDFCRKCGGMLDNPVVTPAGAYAGSIGSQAFVYTKLKSGSTLQTTPANIGTIEADLSADLRPMPKRSAAPAASAGPVLLNSNDYEDMYKTVRKLRKKVDKLEMRNDKRKSKPDCSSSSSDSSSSDSE